MLIILVLQINQNQIASVPDMRDTACGILINIQTEQL